MVGCVVGTKCLFISTEIKQKCNNHTFLIKLKIIYKIIRIFERVINDLYFKIAQIKYK